MKAAIHPSEPTTWGDRAAWDRPSLAAVLAIGLSACGGSAHGSAPPPPPQPPGAVEQVLHPRDAIEIGEGGLVVPDDRVFVLTALGMKTTAASTARFYVDGVQEVAVSTFGGVGMTRHVPFALVVRGGSFIDVGATPNAPFRAWGYLAPAEAAPGIAWIAYTPHPRDLVRVDEEGFDVPQGKLFALTAMGATCDCNASMVLRVDGEPRIQFNGDRMNEIPSGFTVPSGSRVVVVDQNGNSARAWGYLADE